MTPLYAEIHRWATMPFVWGESDCITVLADWVARVHGRDPMENIRGTYDSRASCQRETGFFRDPVGTIDAALETIGGLPRVDEPSPGDIAVIRVAEEGGRVSPCGALWLGTCWACKSQRGAITLRPDMVHGVLAIWGVSYEA